MEGRSEPPRTAVVPNSNQFALQTGSPKMYTDVRFWTWTAVVPCSNKFAEQTCRPKMYTDVRFWTWTAVVPYSSDVLCTHKTRFHLMYTDVYQVKMDSAVLIRFFC